MPGVPGSSRDGEKFHAPIECASINVCSRKAPSKRAARVGGPSTSSGAGKRSRTPDLRITNALLYQLSYAGENRNLFKPCLYYLAAESLAARKPCRA